ncbi:MAG TPA: hypothetical protein VEV17_15660 [Bryobacteraceae bacterium]|nr:hypothetical protein [Bryobacteraceae bacterium]
MEIVDGFIAVAIPFIVSICPHHDGWGVIVHGGREATEADGGIVAKHFAQSIDEAKAWASAELGRRWEYAGGPPKLHWEHLVCNPQEIP